MSVPTSVAVLSPTPTWPPDFGNRKRINRVCEGLRDRGSQVTFFLYALEDDWRGHYPREALEEMRSQWDDVHIIVPSVPYHPLPRGKDHLIDEWWDPAIATYLGWYLQSRRPDALIVNYAYLSKALELAPPGCLRVLDTHDRVGGRRQVLRQLGLRPEFFYTTKEEEAKALDRADLVIAIKAEEAAYFGSLSATPALPVQYVEDGHEVERTPDPDGYLRLGLFGARNNVNVASVSRFLDTALPVFRDNMAPIKVVLAGSMCVDLDAYRSEDSVETLGYVDDVSEFYRSVDVSVVPIEHSTGQKIRVGEALSYEHPIVAHRHAFEGYPISHRLHRLDDMDSLARACVEVAFEQQLLTGLGAASRTSQAIAIRRESHAIDVLAGAIQQHVPVSYFLVSREHLAAEPELRLHIASMVTLAASYSRVRIVLAGADDPREQERQYEQLIAFLRRYGTIHVLAAESETSPDGVGRIDDLEAALRSPEVVGVWVYDEARSARLCGLECEILIGDGFGRFDGSLDGVQGFVSGVEGRVHSGRLHADGESLPRFQASETFNVAPFSTWAASQLTELRHVRPDDRVIVLADAWNQPLAQVALSVVRHRGLGATLVVPDGADVPDADEWLTNADDWQPTVLSSTEARIWLRVHAPSATLDCAPANPGMSVLSAMARLHAHGGRGSAPWKAHSQPSPHALLATIRAIDEHLGAAAGPSASGSIREEDGSVRFHDRHSERLVPHAIEIPVDDGDLRATLRSIPEATASS